MTDAPDGRTDESCAARDPASDDRRDPAAVHPGDATLDDPVALRGVVKQYGGVTALDGVDLRFSPGTVCCLAGPNGSGKTTVLRLVAELTRPTAGTVDAPDAPAGVAFQQPSVYPSLTVAENLAVFGGLVDADSDWREHLVARLRLAPALDRPVAALSGGYTKKLDLALALLKRPALLLLDEPLADLDDLTRRRVVALLDAYAGPGRVVVVSTHRIARFAGALDRLAVVYDGEACLDAAAADLDVPPPDAYRAAIAERSEFDGA